MKTGGLKFLHAEIQTLGKVFARNEDFDDFIIQTINKGFHSSPSNTGPTDLAYGGWSRSGHGGIVNGTESFDGRGMLGIMSVLEAAEMRGLSGERLGGLESICLGDEGADFSPSFFVSVVTFRPWETESTS